MLKALMTVSGFTLLSRVLGLVRDMFIGHYLGVGMASDAWNAAFQFPNFFRRVFGEGAFNSAFVPLYSEKLEKDETEAFAFGNRVIVLLAFILALIFLICFIFIHPIMWLFNMGYDADKLAMTVTLSRITVGYLFFVCLLAAFSGILNSHKKFAAPAMSYAFLNVIFLIGLIAVIPFVGHPTLVLSWSLLIAGVIQLLVVLIPTRKMGLKLKVQRPELAVCMAVLKAAGVGLLLLIVPFRERRQRLKSHLPRIEPDIVRLGVLMIPGVISAGVQQLNLLVGGSVASFQDGARTLIYNADRINQFPLGLIGIAFGVVLLPDIARKVKSDNHEAARESMQRGMVLAMLLALPAMVGIGILAEPIIDVLFRSGKFTRVNSYMAGQALMAFAVGCPAYIMVRVVQPGYFARGDTRTPMIFTFWSAASNMALCLIAFVILRGTGWLHVGCAVATTAAGWLNIYLLIRGLKKDGFMKLEPLFWRKMSKMLVSSLIMGFVVWFAAHLLNEPLHESARVIRFLILTLIASTGIVTYFLVAHVIGAVSFDELKQSFRK